MHSLFQRCSEPRGVQKSYSLISNFRNGRYAGLTVMLTETEESQTADITGFGGREGLLNISWGANSEIAERAAEILESCGFVRE